jgi:hypothetical protein
LNRINEQLIYFLISDDFDFTPDEDEEELHLSHLCNLERLEHLSIAAADFFGHLLFRF